MRAIAALCVSGRSVYKYMSGVIAYDKARDAKTFGGGMPVVAHPPCRLWSKTLSHLARSPEPEAEKNLGLWCVSQVLECGGVMEHPAGSKLFDAANLPKPSEKGEPFLYSIYVEQQWFGYLCRKPTWVLIAGIPRHQLPEIPFGFNKDNTWEDKTDFQRARTMNPFADWLCKIARKTWWSLPNSQVLPNAQVLNRAIPPGVMPNCAGSRQILDAIYA